MSQNSIAQFNSVNYLLVLKVYNYLRQYKVNYNTAIKQTNTKKKQDNVQYSLSKGTAQGEESQKKNRKGLVALWANQKLKIDTIDQF